MKTYETIEELLNAPEGDHCEFKESKNKTDFQGTLKSAVFSASLREIFPARIRRIIP